MNLVFPAQGSLLFLCCSALLHLMTVIMSPVPCFLYANQLPFVQLPCCLLSHHLSSAFPQLLPAVCKELCPSLCVCRGLTLPAKTIPLVAFKSYSVLPKQFPAPVGGLD